MLQEKQQLSREARKAINIDRLFKKQEEAEKRRLIKKKKNTLPEGPNVNSLQSLASPR